MNIIISQQDFINIDLFELKDMEVQKVIFCLDFGIFVLM